MTLSERITAARAALVQTKDALTALATKDELDAAEVLQMEELTAQSERQTADLAVLERAEKALAAGAKAAPGTEVAVQRETPPQTAQRAQTGARSSLVKRPNAADILIRSMLVALEAHISHETHESVIARRYGGSMEVTEVVRLLARGTVNKAANPPAMTSVAGWAAELVREGYGAFLELLAPDSVVPRIPMGNYTFDGFGKIHIPMRANGYPASPSMAGAFRAEGDPIRVGRSGLASKVLTPKEMGVIGTFTKELLRRSTPSIEDEIRTWILEDTAYALDTLFLDAVAGTAVRPAGIQFGMAAGDTAPSGGNTGMDIVADITGRLKQLASYNMGKRPVWVMNSAHAWGLTLAKTPTGEPQFPEMVDGKVAGIPVISSTTVPMSIVFLLDAAQMAFAGGAPLFEGTDVATLHEDTGEPLVNGVTGASVLPLASGAAGAGVVATPMRSLFQTNSAAIKATWELDWTVLRAGCVQTITGVAW